MRYRYDEKSRKRYTTVELIEAEDSWNPVAFNPDSIVRIKIAFDEVDIRQKIKEAGGRWSKSTKTWKVSYKTACELGLKTRIITDKDET